MKSGIIVTPNTKGQIVIPKKMREALGINQQVNLNLVLRTDGIFLQPIKEIIGPTENRAQFLKILEKTRGSWAGDNWPTTENKRRALEVKEAKKRKQAW